MERSKKELEQVKDFFVDEFSNFLVRACVDFDGDHAHSDYWYYWFYGIAINISYNAYSGDNSSDYQGVQRKERDIAEFNNRLGEEQASVGIVVVIVSSVRSSYSHPDLLVTQHQQHPLFQITPVLNTGLSLSEPLQLYKGYNAI